jgi:uncharacterized delta-60 repeat protein
MASHRNSRRSSRNFLESLERRQLLSAGQLDPSFATTGKALVNFNGPNVESTATVVQSDGKTVVAGYADTIVGGEVVKEDIALVRFNFNGTLDTTFGPNHTGIVTLHPGSEPYDYANAIALDTNGKIIVGGTYGHSDGTGQFLLMRLNSNGTLDSTFASNGVAIEDFGTFSESSRAETMAVEPNGKIVMAGYQYVDFGSDQFAVMRFNSNGTLDSSFDGDGRKTIDFPEACVANAIAFDFTGTSKSNPRYGSIYLGGYTQTDTTTHFAVIRLTSTGVLDYSFHEGGRYEFAPVGHTAAEITAMTVQGNGELVVSGYAGTLTPNTYNGASTNDIFAMTRLTTAGIIDAGFAAKGHGWALTSFSNNGRAQSLLVGEGGRLIEGGNAGPLTAMVCYTANGTLDTTFGTAGQITTTFVGNSSAASMNYGPGNRFVVTGGGKFDTARYFDTDGGIVYATGAVENTSEKGPPVNILVYRSENLPVATRVYLSLGGTATPPSLTSIKEHTADYTLSGATIPTIRVGGKLPPPYVDIPAGQTFTTVTLTPIDRGLTSGQKTVAFSVASDASYITGSPSGLTITIKDNDGAATSLKATADAYVQDGSSTGANFGSSPSLVVKAGPSGLNRHTYIKFDLSSVTTINSVKLQLFGNLSNTQNGSVVTDVYSVADTSWTESGITYTNAPAAGTSLLSSAVIAGTTGATYTLDVTAYVKAQKAAGHNTISFVLKDPTTTNAAIIFNSREASGGGPTLLIS